MQRRRRPRALTLTLPDSEQPYLFLDGKKHMLRNFSQEGIGLWVPPPPPLGLKVGGNISGDIVIHEEIFPVRLEIVHCSEKVVGLKILHKSPELTEIFQRLLEPATYAHELRVHPQSNTEDSKTGYHRLWYEGRSGNELIVWYNDTHRSIVAIQLCWKGYWIYRSQFHPPTTGHLKDAVRFQPGQKVEADDVLIPHSEADETLLILASQYLAAVPPPLPGYRLWQFLEMGEQVYLSQEFFAALKVA